jgi:Zn-dependent M28 family amino/carboxypeptidase
MRDVRKLAGDIGVRVRATRRERRAALFIKRRFEHLGYETKVQRFGVDGGTSRNVVAWWPGAKPYGVVVGGHMDSVPRSPGANDNASGVAVVLELARLFAGRDQVRFVRWVAFGSEEFGSDGRHHVGSQVYVNRLSSKGRRRLAGMVSVDMVADGKPLLVGTAGIGPEVAARTLYRKIRKAEVGVEYRTTCDCSDNGPFERAGIPAAFVWSGDEPDYHSPSDKPKNLVPRHLTRTGWGIKAFVRAIDRALVRRLRAH